VVCGYTRGLALKKADKEEREQFWERVWRDPGSREFWAKVSPEVVELVRTQSPKERPDVLDLGCGPGRNAIAFAQAGFKVTATDLSAEAVSNLSDRAGKLGLQVRTLVCDFVDDPFPPESFDIVLSIQALYHGPRAQVAHAIGNVLRWLKRGGIFYFTFPTRQHGEYGKGKELAPHTFELAPGHIHYYADEEDLRTLLGGFKLLSLGRHEHMREKDGVPQLASQWRILAEKP